MTDNKSSTQRIQVEELVLAFPLWQSKMTQDDAEQKTGRRERPRALKHSWGNKTKWVWKGVRRNFGG